MVDIQTIALFLLIGRIVSTTFIIWVLTLQFKLFKTRIDFSLVPNITKMEKRHVYLIRRLLFGLSVALLLSNMVPIAIDTLTLFAETERPANLAPISVAYAASNSFFAMISGFMVWMLYRVAGIGAPHKK